MLLAFLSGLQKNNPLDFAPIMLQNFIGKYQFDAALSLMNFYTYPQILQRLNIADFLSLEKFSQSRSFQECKSTILTLLPRCFEQRIFKVSAEEFVILLNIFDQDAQYNEVKTALVNGYLPIPKDKKEGNQVLQKRFAQTNQVSKIISGSNAG
jgi:hypothetical protein